MQNALKYLVIFMAVLILAGLAVIAVTLISRGGVERAAETGFGAVALGLPEGTVIKQTSIGERRALITVRLPDERERVIVVDLQTGKTIGTIKAGK